MDKIEKVSIENFDIKFFKSVLEQNLMVTNQITIRFESTMIKSAALTVSQTLLKYWAAPMESFIIKDDAKDGGAILDFDSDSFDDDIKKLYFEPFDFYVLKGDGFNKFLSVYGSEKVNLEIEVDRDKNIATSITIIGESLGGSKLKSVFILTSEEFIMNKVTDYAKVISQLTPTDSMSRFLLEMDEIKELKQLIKNLHKLNPQNTSYITFNVDVKNKIVEISDDVFKVTYSLVKNDEIELPEKSFTFNILKSDFIVTGNHSFVFNSNPDVADDFIICESVHKKCVILCMLTKAVDKDMSNAMSNEITDSTSQIDDINLDDYFDN